jgi:hypothetical protein
MRPAPSIMFERACLAIFVLHFPRLQQGGESRCKTATVASQTNTRQKLQYILPALEGTFCV